jgi:hypothetical protein
MTKTTTHTPQEVFDDVIMLKIKTEKEIERVERKSHRLTLTLTHTHKTIHTQSRIHTVTHTHAHTVTQSRSHALALTRTHSHALTSTHPSGSV